MTKLDFPDTPSTGQQFGSSGTVWRWDGTRWGSTAGAAGARGLVGYMWGYGQAATTGTTEGALMVAPQPVVNVIAGRTYSITATFTAAFSTPGDLFIFRIRKGNGVTGEVVQNGPAVIGAIAGNQGITVIGYDRVTTSGSIQYTVTAQRLSGTGTLTMHGSANYSNSVAMEDITYEAGSGGPTSDAFIVRTGDTMSGQLNGITPVAAANLTRKDYVDSKAIWNSAWGFMVQTSFPSNLGNSGGPGEVPILITPNIAVTAGRRVRVTMSGSCSGTAEDYVHFTLRSGSGAGGNLLYLQSRHIFPGNGYHIPFHITGLDNTSTIGQWTFGINRASGSGGTTILGTASSSNLMTVEDIGPVTRQ